MSDTFNFKQGDKFIRVEAGINDELPWRQIGYIGTVGPYWAYDEGILREDGVRDTDGHWHGLTAIKKLEDDE